jgi:GxxExxY protein
MAGSAANRAIVVRMNPHEDPVPREADSPVEGSSDNTRSRLLHGDLTNVIIGAMYDVHTELGAGFLESVYANALAVVLRGLALRVERNVAFDIMFRGVFVGRYVADLVVESTVVVETKVARAIEPAHCAQLRNYLRAAELEVGLVLNFGTSAQFKRVVLTRQR